jgi:nucleoside-diphosphate-sugar epimerase
LEHLSLLEDAVGQAYNIVDDSRPALEQALRLAAEAFGTKSPGIHLPLPLVKAVAWVDGTLSAFRGKVPDLEVDAVNYLYDDYVVDNTKLRETGFVCEYPDFEESIRQLGEAYSGTKEPG